MEKTMLRSHSKALGTLARVLVTGGVLWSMLGIPVLAEPLSKQQIFDALGGNDALAPGDVLSPGRTRSLRQSEGPAQSQPAQSQPGQSQEDQAYIETLRRQSHRSLSSGDRERIAPIVKDRRTVDLEVYFDYNSARLTAQAVPQLNELGLTMAEPVFKDATFLIGGHTDAKGGNAFNQFLSERRAEAVKRFLVGKFHLTAANLLTAGYGKQQLKNAAEPFSGENRRVQVSNLNARAAARRQQ
jgi:outer membrane protein OmpA-like peptidoglycan-associated protein